MKIAGRLIAAVVLIGSTLTACSTLYTQADIDEAEAREDASAQSEAVYDRETAEEGGVNMEAVDEEKEEVERETEY